MIAATIAAALLLLQVPATSRPTPRAPVLSFPEAGLDDSAAYRGYRTRFYRDSRDNAVQIYVDERVGRVVQLWGDAANESVGFTVRDAAGNPARLSWGADTARVSSAGARRTIAWRLDAANDRIEIGWFVLGSMRVERDFQYWKLDRRPYGAPRFVVPEESTLVAALERLSGAEQARHLGLLNATSVAALRSRLEPAIAVRSAGGSTCARALRPSLDGRNELAVELCASDADARLALTGRTVLVTARRAGPVPLTVRTTTDAAPLTPLAREEIFDADFLAFLAAARREESGRSVRYRRLEREVRSVELLSSREKLFAGMPNYATYFGRDDMMTALMMRPVWTPQMTEHVIASVLSKLSPTGHVSHEEALAGQAIREHAGEYAALVASALAASGEARADSLTRARSVLRDLQATRENYAMLDGEFQLPLLVALYLDDSRVPAARKRAFLAEPGRGRTSRLSLLVRELGRMTTLTAPYARSRAADSLVSFVKLDSTHWRSASWRDSRAGYANGRFAMDINAIWAPAALRATERIFASLRTLGVDIRPAMIANSEQTFYALADYGLDSAALHRAAEAWSGAARHFVVTLSPAEIQARVGEKLGWMEPAEADFWRQRLAATGADRAPLSFLALSLDSTARPIPVVNTDPATALFLGDMTGDVVRGTISADSAARLLDPFLRQYPVGLLVSEIGPVVANDAYASDSVWNAFRDDSYHGPRVVWGREVNLLLLGLTKQLSAALDDAGRPRAPAVAAYAAALREAIARTHAAVAASGFEHSELWSYRVENGALRAERYGIASDLQLWSTADLAVQYMLARLPR